MTKLFKNIKPSVQLNKTFTHIIKDYSFGNLSKKTMCELYKDGRAFSYFIEPWLAKHYPLIHVKKNKDHDFIDKNNPNILYDEKTFTHNGCKFCPSNMIGQGRIIDKKIFKKKTKKLIFCIVSNIEFPKIKLKFVRGKDLLSKYPNINIPISKMNEFFYT